MPCNGSKDSAKAGWDASSSIRMRILFILFLEGTTKLKAIGRSVFFECGTNPGGICKKDIDIIDCTVQFEVRDSRELGQHFKTMQQAKHMRIIWAAAQCWIEEQNI